MSKAPSLICVTGTPRGASSAEREDVKAAKAALMVDSGAWKGGLRDGIMAEVRRRSFGVGAGG